MPTLNSLQKELSSLRKENISIKKRLSSVESKLDISVQEELQPRKQNEEQKSPTNAAGIALIIAGGILTLTFVGAIIGLPLLIWGIILVSKRSKESAAQAESGSELKKKEKTPKAGIKPHPEAKPTSLEANIGLKWFSTIGILALVIGIGFFIKYAFENNWIGYLGRILIGVFIGIALISGGEIISKKEKYFRWGLTLVGGGFAITYFAIYSAYHFEEYRASIGISRALDIVLLSLVVICAIWLSFKEDSKIIASEAFFLGFITSLLSENFELLTLIYGLILTIGLVAVVLRKRWSMIGIGGIFATYALYFFWYSDNTSQFWISTTFLITYFVAYSLQAFLLSFDKDSKLEAQNIAATILNSAFFYFLYYLQIRRSYPDYDGLFTIILGAFYLIAYCILKGLSKEKLAVTHLYLAILFITLAVPVQLNKEWITIIWALETVILTLLSFKLKMSTLRYSSYAVGAVTAFKTLLIDSWRLKEFDIAHLSDSTRFFSFLATITAFYFVTWHLAKNKKDMPESESLADEVYSWAGIVMAFFLILLEMKEFWISVGWTALAATVLFLGFYLNRKQFRIQGIVIFCIAVFKVFLYDTRELDTLYRTISFIVLGILLLLASFIYAKYKGKLKEIL